MKRITPRGGWDRSMKWLFLITVILLALWMGGVSRAQGQTRAFPIAPPQGIAAWAASCPEQANVIDARRGLVQINCPDETIDCSRFPGGVIRGWTITPMMTWWMTFVSPKSATGSITARVSGCSLQPVDSVWEQIFHGGFAGLGGPLAACVDTVGCTSADAVPMTLGVAYAVEWVTTDIYPQTTYNQLFGVLIGR